MSPKTRATLIQTAKILVVLVPALLAFLQARLEIRDKARIADHKGAASYQALVKSTEALQAAVTEQHDTLIKLSARMEVMEYMLSQRVTGAGVGGGSTNSAGTGLATATPAPRPRPVDKRPPFPASRDWSTF